MEATISTQHSELHSSDPIGRPILVTGASSGIGHALTRHLAAAGYPVYATARKDRDLMALSEIAGVVPVRLDVRDADQVGAARARVEAEGGNLYGLANNAGIDAASAPVVARCPPM